VNIINTIIELLGKAPIQVILLILGVGFLLLGLGLKTPWGQVTDKKLRWVGVVFGGIFVIASLLCILVLDCKTDTGVGLTPEVTEAVTQEVIDTATPEGGETATESPVATVDITTLSSGAQFLASDYFGGLNDEIQTEDDLEHYWDLLSKNVEKAVYDNDFDVYKNHWWERRVKFKLYECSDTEFILDLDYYAREDIGFVTSIGKTEDMKYTLAEKSGNLYIDSIDDISAEGHFCDFVYEN
jgi:hypothetical protein